MDFNTDIRKKQLDNLDQLISSSQNRIQSVFKYLGWTEENVAEEDSLVQCPINIHHRINPKSWNEHVEKCVVQIEGYDPKSQFLSESVDDPNQSIYIDRNKKIELITKELSEKGALKLAWNGLDPDPRTTDRLMSTYSPNERSIFYNYAIANTTGPPPPPEFTTILAKKDEEKSPTYEEILIQERDAKRKRTKYKSVHINRKNHTEVIREVIDGQMEEYKEWLVAQTKTKITNESNGNNGCEEVGKEEQERPHSSISRNSNHSSSSRSTSRRYGHYRDRRELSQERHHNSRDYDRKYKHDEKHRYSSEDRRHRYTQCNERRRSRERERRRSPTDRKKHYYDEMRRH